MSHKLEVDKKIANFSESKNAIESEDSFDKEVESSFLEFDKTTDEALSENKDLANNLGLDEVNDICDDTKKEIQAAAKHHENLFIKLFNKASSKVDQKFEQFKNKRKYNSLNKSLSSYKFKLPSYSEKAYKYLELKNNGQPEKFDSYFDSNFESFTDEVEEFRKLQFNLLSRDETRNIEINFKKIIEPVILRQIEKGEIDMAISLWSDYPSKNNDKNFAYEMAAGIGKKIISKSFPEYTDNKEDRKKYISFVKNRLESYPEIYCLYLLSIGDKDYMLERELRSNQTNVSALNELGDNSDSDYTLNFVSLENNILKRDLNPELTHRLFFEFLKNSPRKINDNFDIFQSEFEQLGKAEREEFIKSNFYSGDILSIGKYLHFDKGEINSLLNSDRAFDKRGVEEENETKIWLEHALNTSTSYLAILTNADNFNLSPIDQEDILKNISEKRGNLEDFKQLLTYPDKYPGLSPEVVSENFKNYLNNNKNSGTFTELIYNKIDIPADIKKEYINDVFTNFGCGDFIDFLSKNDHFITIEDREFIENKLLETYKANQIVLYDISGLTEKSVDKIVNAVDQIASNHFLKLLLSGDKNFAVDGKYYSQLLQQVDDADSFVLALNNRLENKLISEDKFSKIQDDLLKTLSVEKLLRSSSITSDVTLLSKFSDRVISSGNVNGLFSLLYSIKNKNLEMARENQAAIYKKLIQLVTSDNILFLYGSYSVELKEQLDVNNHDDLMKLCILEKNGSALGRAIEEWRDISEDTFHQSIEAIINFGDYDSRTRLLNIIKERTDYPSYYEGMASIDPDKNDSLIEKIMSAGTGKELTGLIVYLKNQEYSNPDKVEDRVNLIKNKIISSLDGEAIMSLYVLDCNQPQTVNLNSEEIGLIGKYIFENIKDDQALLHSFIQHGKKYGLNEDKFETLLSMLGKRDGEGLLDILNTNINNNYFKLSKTAQRRIIDSLIENKSCSLTNLYYFYATYHLNGLGTPDDNPFDIDSKQVDALLSNIKIQDNPGKALLNNTRLSKLRESLSDEQKTKILIFSEDQEQILVSTCIDEMVYNHHVNLNELQNITDNYYDHFESTLIKSIQVGKNEPFIELMRINLAIVEKVVLGNKAIILEEFHDFPSFENINTHILCLADLYRTLVKLNLLKIEDLNNIDETLQLEKNNRQKTINFTTIFNALLAGKADETIDDLVGEKISKKFQEFKGKYNKSSKGTSILTLLAASEYNRAIENGSDYSFKSVFLDIARKLDEYEMVILEHEKQEIPDGLKASIGMEYEATKIIEENYNEKTGSDYKNNILNLSSLGNIGKGADAVHEFATRPTENPYLMLLEMKLLQDLDFIDFNFKSEDLGGYYGAASGFHLTIGGENPIQISDQINFLQNIVVASNLGGVCSGQEVAKVGRGRGSIRQRNSGCNNVKVFDNLTDSVELRSFSIDKWEQFERNILVNYHGAIAVQALEKYTTVKNFSDVENLVDKMPKNSEDLYSYLERNSFLKTEIEDNRIKEIIYQWLLLQVESIKTVSDHNSNFLDNETSGYLDDDEVWVDVKDFSRGRDNKGIFESIVNNTSGKILSDYFEQDLKFNSASEFFKEITPDLVNKLTRINNLYLKGDRVNILNMLGTTIVDGVVDSNSKAAEESVFDNGNQGRAGRYYIQGSSDRLIINRSQDLLLNFVEKMQEIMKPKAEERAESLAA